MSTLKLSRVNHKTVRTFYFKDIKDDDKDLVLYTVRGAEESSKNFKKFIAEYPSVENILTKYHFNLALDEMRYELFHDIRYKKVDNKSFYKRMKTIKYKKVRYYHDGMFVTLFFNTKSKSMAVESDFVSALFVYSGYPKKGLTNFLLQPCCVEKILLGQKCTVSEWAMISYLKHIDADYDVLCKCFSLGIKLDLEDYFYVKPGENDLLLEGYTIDYDKGYYNTKCTEYYIIDRECDYFKKGTTSMEDFKDYVTKKFNELPQRVELFAKKTDDSGYAHIIEAVIKTDEFKNADEMFGYLGRSMIGRGNAFIFQWNSMIGKFNNSEDGFYCPKKNALAGFGADDGDMPVIESLSYNEMTEKDEYLMQKRYDIDIKHVSVKAVSDVKFFTPIEICAYNVTRDRYSEDIDINLEKRFF